MTDERDFLELGAGRSELVVALHGYSSAGNRLQAGRRVIHGSLPNADVFTPELPFAKKWLCRESVEDIVVDLMKRISNLIKNRKSDLNDDGYKEIILVGHSFRAVLARKIAILANGEQQTATGDVPAPFEGGFSQFCAPQPWAPLLRRLVLLAGMNRGWSVSSTMNWGTSVWWSSMEFFGETVVAFFVGKPTIFAIRRGARFLIQTRLQWLALMNPVYGPRPDIIAVQLLGTIDDFVSPDDNVDYVVDDPSYNNQQLPSFFYLEVQESDHKNVIEMVGNSSACTLRASVFGDALTLN